MRSQGIEKVNGPNHCDVASTTTGTSKQITGRWFALQRYVKSANLLNCVPTYVTFLLRLFYQYQFYLTQSKTALRQLQPVEAAPAHCWAISLINWFFFNLLSWFDSDVISPKCATGKIQLLSLFLVDTFCILGVLFFSYSYLAFFTYLLIFFYYLYFASPFATVTMQLFPVVGLIKDYLISCTLLLS